MVPVDLVCPKCKKLFSNPMLLPCCGESLCRPCVDLTISDSRDSRCPLCTQHVASRRLCANFALSRAVDSFRYMQGHSWSQMYVPPSSQQIPAKAVTSSKGGMAKPPLPTAPARPSALLVPPSGFGPSSKLKHDAPEFVPVATSRIPIRSKQPVTRSTSHSPPGIGPSIGPSSSMSSLGALSNLSDLSAGLSASVLGESPPDAEPLDIEAVCRSTQPVKASMLVRVLARCTTIDELDALLVVLEKSPHISLPTNGEIGTLVVKAACRTSVPERAYTLFAEGRIRPTLGGVHYLMIHFSIKNNTPLILKIFDIARRHGMRPNVNTFHILIRACVNHNMIDQALKFAAECMTANIRPNRVVFNLLMKGCYKANQPYQILNLREQMDDQCRMEINDTTVKFTVMAYIMLDRTEKALEELLSYASGDVTKLEDVCLKFFEMSDGDNIEHFHLLALFHALREADIQLPPSVEYQLSLFHVVGQHSHF
eukprot:TRINITY_DN3080_c1_g1_i2.p1 TRINITY_DN3080_c1_g1~~TRINITY_DN3080_c1_g1_i2.p1  ORF type:complete len:532 (-),score=145.61 TRINITY_DN3080_c1_g1_i2:478-1923(-)